MIIKIKNNDFIKKKSKNISTQQFNLKKKIHP